MQITSNTARELPVSKILILQRARVGGRSRANTSRQMEERQPGKVQPKEETGENAERVEIAVLMEIKIAPRQIFARNDLRNSEV